MPIKFGNHKCIPRIVIFRWRLIAFHLNFRVLHSIHTKRMQYFTIFIINNFMKRHQQKPQSKLQESKLRRHATHFKEHTLAYFPQLSSYTMQILKELFFQYFSSYSSDEPLVVRTRLCGVERYKTQRTTLDVVTV